MKALSAWSWSAGAGFVNLALGIVTGIFVARILGPEKRGELAEVVYWASLVTAFGACSIPTALTYTLARQKGDASTIASACTVAILLAFASILAGAVLLLPFVDPKLRDLTLAYLCVLVPANFLGLSLLAVDHAKQRFFRYNLLRVVPPATYFAAIAVLWLCFSVDVTTLLMASCLGSLVICLFCLFSNRHELAVGPRLGEMRTLMRTGLQHHAAAFASMLFQNADRFIVIMFFTHANLGAYAVALSLSSAGVGVVSSGTSTVLFPKLAANAEPELRRFQLRNGLGASVVVAALINLAIAAATPVLLPFLFGERFADAVPLAILLCLAQIPASFVSVAFIALRALGDWRAGPHCQLLGVGVFLLSAVCLNSIFGLKGVPLALIFGQTAAAAYLLYRMRATLGLSVHECLLPDAAWTASVLRRLNLALTGRRQQV